MGPEERLLFLTSQNSRQKNDRRNPILPSLLKGWKMTILQNFIFNFEKLEVTPLFFQSEQVPTFDSGKLSFVSPVDKDSSVSFDGIGNSLPVQILNRHTSVQMIRCDVTLDARHATLQILRVDRQGVSHLLHETTFESEQNGKKWESPWFPVSPDEGRYALSIRFRGHLEIAHAAWVGDADPVSRPKFLISIPAYKRNESVISILSDFGKYTPLSLFDIAFLIVDHGKTLSRSMLPDDSRIHFISQDNFGSTGGFMRAFLFAKDISADYLLTADDDILITPEMFYRIMVLQTLSNKLLVVGSVMITIQNPTLVAEQGAQVVASKVRFAHAHSRNIRLLSPTERSAIYEEKPCDYTAWWLSCSPVKALSPLPPYFMRGDDVLEGILLGKNNALTVVPPHCFVWHEAFATKSSPWRAYLSFRNDLTNRFILGGPPFPLRTAVSILGVILPCILNYDYNIAGWYIRALNDTLDSPEWILDPARQTEIVHRWMKEEPPATDLSPRLSLSFEKALRTPRSRPFRAMRRITYFLTGANYLNPFTRELAPDGGLAFRIHGDYQGWGTIGYSQVAVINPEKKGYICRRSWKLMIKTTFEAFRAVFRFLMTQQSVTRGYQTATRSEDIWRKAFGISRHESLDTGSSERKDR